jgi:hypothetical protein
VILHVTRLDHVRAETPLAVELLTTLGVNSNLSSLRLITLISLHLCIVLLSIGHLYRSGVEWEGIAVLK